MATLTVAEKQQIRNWMERKSIEEGFSLRWVKAALNAAAQAVEDELESAKPSISSAVDTATSAYSITLTNTEKKRLGAIVMNVKYLREDTG